MKKSEKSMATEWKKPIEKVKPLYSEKELLTMSFQGSENSYKYTTIYLTNIIMYDNNGNELIWEDFSSSGVCYIDKHPTSDELIFEEFTWRNDFCFPLNYDPSSSGQ